MELVLAPAAERADMAHWGRESNTFLPAANHNASRRRQVCPFSLSFSLILSFSLFLSFQIILSPPTPVLGEEGGNGKTSRQNIRET